MRKHKGIIITATILLAAIAVVAGKRFVKNQDNNEKNSRETEKVDVAEKKVEVKKESDTHQISDDDFYVSKIPDDIFEKMQGKSYKDDCTVPRDELRYLHVLHMGFDGQTKEGELVVNKAIADDVLAIFEELYQADYPIDLPYHKNLKTWAGYGRGYQYAVQSVCEDGRRKIVHRTSQCYGICRP